MTFVINSVIFTYYVTKYWNRRTTNRRKKYVIQRAAEAKRAGGELSFLHD